MITPDAFIGSSPLKRRYFQSYHLLNHYGDNNETPTMPATRLAEHHFLADPATRQLARRNTRCYWRQSSPATPWQGTLVGGSVEARPLTDVMTRMGSSPSSG
jgi:hypothetical protein